MRAQTSEGCDISMMGLKESTDSDNTSGKASSVCLEETSTRSDCEDLIESYSELSISHTSESIIQHVYKEQKAGKHAVLPPFEASRASMHLFAPAHNHKNPFRWTVLAGLEKRAAYQKLCDSVHGKGLLAKFSYRLDPYMRTKDWEKWRKCIRCNKNRKQMGQNSKHCHYHPKPAVVMGNTDRFHVCCGKREPCKTTTGHEWEKSMSPAFEDLYNSFIETPPHDPACAKHKAVVVDCEMVGVFDRHNALTRLCAVDYVTGEILIDCFVDPVEKVFDYRASSSGITAQTLARAKRVGNCLPNWRAARDTLLRFVDAETIIIGSGLRNDLDVLRLVHTNIVDPVIISQQRVGTGLGRLWGLKTLCKEILNLRIQMGKDGHDPLEDCMATREIVLCMTYTNKCKFMEWAVLKKKEQDKLEEERRAHLEERRNEHKNSRPIEDENTQWGLDL